MSRMDEHIPHVELSRFAQNELPVESGRREEIERHVASCAECGAAFDFYRAAEDDLGDFAVWQPILGSTAAAMSAYALRCAAEDAEADELLAECFAHPRRTTILNVNKRKYQTGGVVRRLNAKAHELLGDEPFDALLFAELAQIISELLPDDLYPNNAVYELRGTAWKEGASALRCMAKFDEALESLRRAERAYRHLRSSGYGLAAVALGRAAVHYERSDFAEAAKHAELAEQGYAHLGLEHERVKAVFLLGAIRYEALDLAEASMIFQRVIDFGEELDDRVWIAKGSYAQANCELDRGNSAEASRLFHRALVIFRETGPAEDRIAVEWGLARVVLHGGRTSDAVWRLRDVIAAFEEIGCVSPAAIAGIDLSEALLVLERWNEIAKVASHAFRLLEKAGDVTGALSALAYVKHAASRRRLTPSALKDIRKYLHRVEHQPDLCFVPPPDDLG